MRLFKYAAVVAVASAGKKFEANEEERECISQCKDRISCHGQDNTDGPTECIQECRDECISERKDAIKDHLAPRTNLKRAQIKAENTQKRAEAREAEKAKNPAPMIKDFHQLYEDGEVPRRFIACLKKEREELDCVGHGQELWPCKREMVWTCLEKYDDFDQLGSDALIALKDEFYDNLNKMEMLSEEGADSSGMQNDAGLNGGAANEEEAESEEGTGLLGIKPNKKNKTKVNSIVKALKKNKEGKIDTSHITVNNEESPSYETEPEYDEEPEDAPLENEMANDWSDLNQQAEHEEEVEAEDEPKWEKAKKDPKAIYSYVGKGGSRRVNGGKNRKAQLASSTEHIQLPHVKRLTKDQFVNEMCRCRTSMEHFRVKNYLARNGELDDWEHHDETCKWCAFPNSKKCWQCQVHWKKASDNENIPRESRVRNEQIEMACFLYVKNVKNGKFKPMNTRGNDPCEMRKMSVGKFNAWHLEGKYGDYFAKYKELHHAKHTQS